MNRSLTAVPGLLAGHWTHATATTGVTAVLFPTGAAGGVALRGHATGTVETPALSPTHVAPQVHGFCLSGGSAFGLAASGGVRLALEARGVGFDTGFGRVPIVAGAALFDLPFAAVRPGEVEGRLAADAASADPLPEGKVGAGAGATVAKSAGTPLPGGFGGWSVLVGPFTVAAGVALNAFGCVRDPDTGAWLAGDPAASPAAPTALPGRWSNTTLAIVATDAPLDRAGSTVLADMAAGGFARCLYPAFSPFDGDTVFAASTGAGAPVDAATLSRLGDVAATCVATAILRAVQASSTTR